VITSNFKTPHAMNVIILYRDEIAETPILVKHDTTAEAVFESLATELLGEDADEVDFFCDSALSKVNSLLRHQDLRIEWFCDIDVNTYKN
jgi:hypothetical protein